MKICLNCKKETKNPKFCSKICFNKFYTGKTYEEIYGKEKSDKIKELIRVLSVTKEKKTFICKNCGKKFKWSPVSNRVFCSVKCNNFFKRGKSYEERLGEERGYQYRLHVAEATKKSWKEPSRFTNINGFHTGGESQAHKNLKKIIGDYLIKKGYEVFEEVPIFLRNYFRIADIVGIKNNGMEKVAVECGGVDKHKFKEYSDIFQWIIHVPYKGEIKLIKGLF